MWQVPERSKSENTVPSLRSPSRRGRNREIPGGHSGFVASAEQPPWDTLRTCHAGRPGAASPRTQSEAATWKALLGRDECEGPAGSEGRPTRVAGDVLPRGHGSYATSCTRGAGSSLRVTGRGWGTEGRHSHTLELASQDQRRHRLGAISAMAFLPSWETPQFLSH